MRNKDLKYILFGIILSVIAYHQWISFEIFSYGDYYFSSAITLKDFLNLSVWNHSNTLGGPDVLLWRTPINLIYGVFGSFNLDQRYAEKFILLWPYIFFSFPISYLFINKIIKSSFYSFIGGLMLCFNTYFLSINTQGHFLIPLAFFAFLTCFYFIIDYFEQPEIKKTIKIALFYSLTVWLDLRIAYLGFIILGTYILKELFKGGLISRYIRDIVLVLFIIFLLNSFWIIPLLQSASLTNNIVLSRDVFGNEFWSILHTISLHHPFWNIPVATWFKVTQTPIYLLFFSVVILISLLSKNKNKNYFWFFMFLIGTFLAKGETPPFGFIYKLFFDNLLGFSAFRDPSKFYLLIILSSSVLITQYLKNNINLKLNKIVTLLTALITLVLISPYILNRVNTTLKPQSIPREYVDLNNYLSHNIKETRTLWVPFYSRWTPINNKVNSIDSTSQKIDISKSNLSKLSYDFVIIPSEEEDSKIFEDNLPRSYYLQHIDRKKYQETNIGNPKLSIFKVLDSYKRIYVLPENKYEIAINTINASHINIVIKEPIRNARIIFNDTFNPNWSLYDTNKFSYINLLTGKSKAIEYLHQNTDDGFNSFLLGSNNTVKNITLFFRPQLSYLICLFIGSVSFVALLIYLIFKGNG